MVKFQFNFEFKIWIVSYFHIESFKTVFGSNCVNECKGACSSISGIETKDCNRLCQNHCENFEEPLKMDQVKCLLICGHLDSSSSKCKNLCLDSQEQSIEEKRSSTETGTIDWSKKTDCVGNGKEICYKYCRLKKNKDIPTCRGICCTVPI